jgi:hypothetical protein
MFRQEAHMNKPSTTRSERRRSRRQRPKPTTEIACRSEETLLVGANLAASVLDISADGIRLRVNSPLAVGQKIEVDLEGIGYCRPLHFTGEVVWSLQTVDGFWCIGVKF